MYYDKYVKYKNKYIALKRGGLSGKYNKNYNRSGIIPYFILENTREIFLLMTKSVIKTNITISDFGGMTDDFTTEPNDNAYREYLEESTYVDSKYINDKSKITENNNMLENINELKTKIVNDNYIVLFNLNDKIKNYLYLVEITDPKYIRWGNNKINLTYNDIQYVSVANNNLYNEISEFVIVKQTYITNIKHQIRFLIYDTIHNKYSYIFNVIKKLNEYKIRDLIEKSKKDVGVKDCIYTNNLCDTFYEPRAFLLNDTIKNNFACTKPQIDKLTNIRYIILPKGFYFYKTITLDPLDNNELSNSFANDYSWYGDLMTAMSYMSWYNKETITHKLYPYKLERDIRLINIGDVNNLEYLDNTINSKIKKLFNQHVTSIQTQYDRINTIRRYLNQLKYIRYTTGFKQTWQDQLTFLKHTGLSKSINKRKKDLPQNLERCKIDDTIYGDQYFDLNRVSATLGADKILMSAICEHINVDGYYSQIVPSYWHLNNKFNAEIAVCLSRGVLQIDTQNPYYDTNSKQYKEAEFASLNIFKPIKTYDIIAMDIPYAKSLKIERIKQLYNTHHLLLFTIDKMNFQNDTIKKEMLYDYIYDILYEINSIEQILDHDIVKKLGTNIKVDKICSSDKKFQYNCTGGIN